jgi:hypothetical protein
MKTETFHGQSVDMTDTEWRTFIMKPIYDKVVYVNEKLIKAAKKAKVQLRVECPGGSSVYDPAEILLNGRKIEKVFKIKEKPMILYKLDLEEVL